MNVNAFTKLFQQAIYGVSRNYYDSQPRMEHLINSLIDDNRPDRTILRNYLRRYAERPFCYELYHQARIGLESHFRQNPPHSPDDEIQLQGEVQKRQIERVIQYFDNIQRPLDRPFIPDFLLHSAHLGNDRHQIAVIEVKTDPNLTFLGDGGSMKDDLAKIQIFINNYNYQLGIFVTVNSSPQYIYEMFVANQEWIQKNIESKSRILILCKENYDACLFQCDLQDQRFQPILRT